MEIGVTIPNNTKVAALAQPWLDEVGGLQILEAARLADELGFARLTCAEHFCIPAEQVELSSAHHLHAVTALAFVASATERIRLASNISLAALQHPVVQAKQWATLDWLSGGRTDFMIGVGWLEGEFDALGVDFNTRGARVDEYVSVMKALWTQDTLQWKGEHVRFGSISAEPKPLQEGGVPLWFAGDVPATMRRVARWGAGWAPFQVQPETFPRHLETIKGDPAYGGQEIGLLYNLSSRLISSGHRAVQDSSGIEHGNADALVDELGRLAGLGVTEVTVPLPPAAGFPEYLDWLRWLAAEVLPLVRPVSAQAPSI